MTREEKRLYDEAESLIRNGPWDRPGEARPNETWCDVLSEIGDFVTEAKDLIERLKDAYDSVCDERDEVVKESDQKDAEIAGLQARIAELEGDWLPCHTHGQLRPPPGRLGGGLRIA